MNNILFLFLAGLLVVSVLFFLSQVYIKLDKGINSTFKAMSISVIAVTTVYALVLSSFTSYLLILLVFFIYGFIRKKVFNQNSSSDSYPSKIDVIKEWSLLVCYFIFTFFILNIQTIFQTSPYINLQEDFSFYSGVSEVLNITGIENIKIDIALAKEKSFSFYHYFELWFNALLGKFFAITYQKALMFIALPVLSSILLKGLFELQQNLFSKFSIFKTNWKYILPLSIFFLFPFTMTFRWLLSLGADFNPWNPSIALWMKLKWIVVLSGLIYLFQDYHKNKLKNIVLISGFICVVYPTTMIAILPSLVLWILLYRNKMTIINYLDLLVIIIGIGVIMWYLNGMNDGLNAYSSFEAPSTYQMVQNYFFKDKSNLIMFVKEPILRTIYILVSFLPIIVLLFFKKKSIIQLCNKYLDLISLFIVIYVVSFFGVILLDFSKDGEQIHKNIFNPLYILFLYLGCIYFIKDRRRSISKASIAILIFACLLNIFGLLSTISKSSSKETINYSAVVNHLKNFDGRSAYITDSTYFNNEFKKNFYFEIPAHNIRFDVKNYFPHLLSLDRIKIESILDKFYVGYIYNSSRYFKSVIEHKLTYEEIFKNEEDLKVLIIHNNAPELENAESVFGVKYLGEIDNFSFFKKIIVQ